jgi:hypothetical protein
MVKHPNHPFVWVAGILNQYDDDLDFFLSNFYIKFPAFVNEPKRFYKDRPLAVLLDNPHNR